ncbi:MAG: iron dependent repressor, metal binding and dimerization domain protein [Bacteroidota bacterium]
MGSVLFAPQQGILARSRKSKANSRKINRENILKILYRLGEDSDDFSRTRNNDEIRNWRNFNAANLEQGLKELGNRQLIELKGPDINLTAAGLLEAKRIVRLHRLWELYLTVKLRLPSDHVHQDAEAIEHVITPELEELLIAELENPGKDPHNSIIP